MPFYDHSSSYYLFLQESTQYRNTNKGKPKNRKYSRWEPWTQCPQKCKTHCYQDCVRTRKKSCIRSEICGSKVIQIEKACGRCQSTTAAAQMDPPQTTPIPLSMIITPPTHSIRRTQSLQLVTLESHCLPDYHFSKWGDWSECLPVCRKVRFRHCTTSLCKERVPHMEDRAVKQEEWCVPPPSSDQQQRTGQSSCQSYLSLMRSNTPTPMELKQCEKARRKKLSDEQSKERKKSGGRAASAFIFTGGQLFCSCWDGESCGFGKQKIKLTTLALAT